MEVGGQDDGQVVDRPRFPGNAQGKFDRPEPGRVDGARHERQSGGAGHRDEEDEPRRPRTRGERARQEPDEGVRQADEVDESDAQEAIEHHDQVEGAGHDEWRREGVPAVRHEDAAQRIGQGHGDERGHEDEFRPRESAERLRAAAGT